METSGCTAEHCACNCYVAIGLLFPDTKALYEETWAEEHKDDCPIFQCAAYLDSLFILRA